MIEKIQIEIKVLPEDQFQHPNTIIITDQLVKSLNIHNVKQATLSVSRYSEEVSLVFINDSDSIIYCSPALLERLALPIQETISISIKKMGSHSLILGPIIALVTEVREQNHTLSLGSIETFCEELANYCEQQGIFFYICSLQNFFENFGYVYSNNQWHKSKVPYPHVIHNRIHSRKKEHSSEFKRFTEELNFSNIPYFNGHFLNKWQVHEILQGEEHIATYLPETKLLSTKLDLEEMLAKHSCVFLKPIHGSQGRRIFRIKQTNNQEYQLDYTTLNGEIDYIYEDFQSLYQALRPRLYQKGYIVQQGIDLYSYQNRPLDFRFLCQKKDSDIWKVTSAVARVSSKEDFVSNLARGGELKKVYEVLIEQFSRHTALSIKRMMGELALEVSNIVSSSFDGVFAELGIDLAIDLEGKPWVIEVNTKPSKNLDPSKLSSKVRPSAKALIQHCVFLAKYPDSE